MSQQSDDEGTVIRPTTTSTGGRGVVSTPTRPEAVRRFDSAEDNLSLQVGSQVAEFEITGRIGEGGFSIVYLAMDRSLERTVALKEYMPSSLATRIGSTQVQPRSQRHRDTFEAGLKSFVNEAKLLAQFDHPSLVKVYRFWEANGTAYMVMPYYQGVTVKDAVRAMPQAPDEAWLLALLDPLTEALLVIHAEHCYHRDIAPDNVILLANSAKPLLLDFGAARRVIGDMTQGLTVILKSGYAPVEQYAEVPGMKQGSWTDVYALAAVVYWAITGSTPPASVGRMLSDSFVPLSQCAAGRYSDRFLQAIDRALILRPEQRTPSIGAFRQDLGLDGEQATGTGSTSTWDDPEATVIRPIARGAMRTATRPASHPFTGPARTAPPMPTAPAAPEPPTPPGPPERQAEDLSERTPRLDTPGAVSPPATPVAEEKRTGRPRAVLLASVAIAAVLVATGAWWGLQASSDASASSAPAATAPNASDGAAAVKAVQPEARGTTEAPVATAPLPSPRIEPTPLTPTTPPPSADVPAISPPPIATEPRSAMQTSPAAGADSRNPRGTPAAPRADAPTEAPTPVVAEAPKPPSPTTMPPTENVAEPSPARVTRRASPTDGHSAAIEPRIERASRTPTAPKAEHPPARAADEAECVRIFQRLSLGESSPALLERLKTLKCR